ncbi:MAG: wax ester/triacylglycerol synthase domain-containing protein [Sporichthyaceae bacterium]
MSELESTMWRANRHPYNSTQGSVLQILAGVPRPDQIHRWHEYWLARFPRFRQRVVEPALNTGPPVWVDDADFDVDYHVRILALPEPGDREQLLTLCQAIAGNPLDPARPPWTGTFLTGLEGGRSAYLLVLNHTLMDGFGSLQFFAGIHNVNPDDCLVPTEPAQVEPTPSGWQISADQVLGAARSLPQGALRAVGLGLAAGRDPRGAARFLASVGRVLAQPPPSSSPILREATRTTWRFGTLSCPLADLRAAAKAAGGTVNDAYVCAILGGLRRYHEQVGWRLDDVTINMPVNLRGENDTEGGNRFVTAFLRAPASVVDPMKRMQAFRAVVAAKSAEPALDFFSLVLPVVNRAPAAVLGPLFTTMQNRVDVTVSNVPGPREEVRLLGHVVEGIHYFGPLPGSPLMVVLSSLAGTCHISINCDGQAFDRDRLLTCLREGLDEILAVGMGAG